jgi:hypothetical protein
MHQEDPSAHLPPLHNPEQQVVVPPSVALQGLPAVAQELLSGLQLPEVQLPLQQADDSVQGWLSATQLVPLAQAPRVVSHCRLQQSVLTPQGLPDGAHVVTYDLQALVAGSQASEQHSLFVAHGEPAILQTTPMPPAPPLPALAAIPP